MARHRGAFTASPTLSNQKKHARKSPAWQGQLFYLIWVWGMGQHEGLRSSSAYWMSLSEFRAQVQWETQQLVNAVAWIFQHRGHLEQMGAGSGAVRAMHVPAGTVRGVSSRNSSKADFVEQQMDLRSVASSTSHFHILLLSEIANVQHCSLKAWVFMCSMCFQGVHFRYFYRWERL